MPSAIHPLPQHSIEELKEAYRASTDAVERRRIQAIWLLLEGKSRQEVLNLSAYSRISLCDIIKRYNSQGLLGLRDCRHDNSGCPPLLDEQERAQLLSAMQSNPQAPEGWTAAKLQVWVKEQLGKDIYLPRAYELLHHLGYSLQRPRPQHAKADELLQENFKKTSCPTV